MAEGEKKNWTLEVITIIAICLFLWWKTRKKSTVFYEPKPEIVPQDTNPNPLLDPYRDSPMVCDEIIAKPLAPFDLQMGGELNIPRGTCFRGDGSKYADSPTGYGSAYAEQQAEEFSLMKQDEAVLNLNRKTITFRLINSTAVKAPVTVLDTTQNPAPFDPVPPPVTYNDWFLPSEDELNEMVTQLYKYGVGNFIPGNGYVSSSESSDPYAEEYFQSVECNTIQVHQPIIKSDDTYPIRPCRAFTSTTNYNLRDIGPAGGYIFWKSGNDYLEAAPADSASQAWSNIINAAIGTTGTAIGTGQANTTAIINQVVSILTTGNTWSSNPPDNFDTFVPDGVNITSAISSGISDAAMFLDSDTFVSGGVMRLEFELTLNSGTVPSCYISDDISDEMYPKQQLAEGHNLIVISTLGFANGNMNIDIRNSDITGIPFATNFSISGLTCTLQSSDSAAKLCDDLVITI